MPTYSVIITTHDRAALLPRAIRSVKTQGGVTTQTIVVSDRVCPETYAVAAALLDGDDLFVQRAGLPGPAVSRNLGISLARGEHIVFLDDDDALSPGFLQSVSEHVDGHTVLYADHYVILERLENGAPIAVSGERRSLAAHELGDIYAKNFIPFPCLIYPRRAVETRKFDPSLVLNEDWEFILNVMSDHPLRHIPVDGPIIFVREAADNRGRTNDHLLPETYLRIYRNRPAPTEARRLSRQALLQSVGIAVALDHL